MELRAIYHKCKAHLRSLLFLLLAFLAGCLTAGQYFLHWKQITTCPEAQTPDEGMSVDRRKRQAKACVRKFHGHRDLGRGLGFRAGEY